MNKPKAIGTAAETAATRYLVAHGWPHAERRTLKGRLDQGDITGTPGVVWEVKGGEAAKSASDLLVADWLEETETERINAGAEIGVLILQRRGVGPANAGRWWAVMSSRTVTLLSCPDAVLYDDPDAVTPSVPVRMYLSGACQLLRWAGFGAELPVLEVPA